jgi:hypothetical protein
MSVRMSRDYASMSQKACQLVAGSMSPFRGKHVTISRELCEHVAETLTVRRKQHVIITMLRAVLLAMKRPNNYLNWTA